jgi:hypothetical protein
MNCFKSTFTKGNDYYQFMLNLTKTLFIPYNLTVG